MLSGALTAPLSQLEERRILEDALGGPAWWRRITHDDVAIFGRLRPVFLGWHFLKVALFGAQPLPQHLLTLALGVVAAFALSRALRTAGAGLACALLFPALTLLSGTQGAIWFLLMSAAENVAMPLLALALWGLVHAARARHRAVLDAAWLTAAVLAALAKESFALVLPALLLLRVGLEARAREQDAWRTARRHAWLLALGFAAFVLLVGAAAFLLWRLPESYGAHAAARGARSLAPAAWWAGVRTPDVRPLALQALVALPLLGLLASRAPADRGTWARLALGLAACLAWSVPQAALYGDTLRQRYALPFLVAPAALYACTLDWLWRTPRHWARALALLGWGWAVVTTAGGTAVVFRQAWWWGAEARSTAAAVTLLARVVPAERTIVMVADPSTAWGFSGSYALPLFLQQAGFGGRVLLVPVEARPAERTALHAPLAAGVIASRGLQRHGDPARVGGAIVVNEDQHPGGLLRLMELGRWRDCGRPEPLYRLQWRPPFVVHAGTFVRRALVRWSPSPGFPPERPLVRVAPALTDRIGVNPVLATPYGLELVNDRTVAWLPPADVGGLEGVLWAERTLDVRVRVNASHGPSCRGLRRTLRFALGRSPEQVRQASFERGAVVTFDVRLRRGANRFRVAALDPADVPTQPNGDPRALVVLVHAIVVAPR